MDFITKLNKLIGLYLTAFKSIFKGGIWLPFIIYGAVQFIVLVFLANYTNPFIYPLLSPLVNFLFNENAELFDHYPTMYLMLPYLFQWFKIAVGLIAEGLVVGLTVILVLKVLAPGHFKSLNLGFAKKQWFQLALGWALITAVLWTANRYLPVLFSDLLESSPRRQMVFDLGMKLVTVALYSVVIYVLPALIVYRNGLVTAFRTSFTFFVRNPIFSFFMALIPILITWPIAFMLRESNTIIQKFSPELVYYLLGAGIFIDFIANCLITVAVVKFLLDESD